MEWGIIEIMGHGRHAGQWREATFCGAQILEVHQPAHEIERTEREGYPGRRIRRVVERYPARLFRVSAANLYRMVECTEAEAREALPYTSRPTGLQVEIVVGEWVEPAPQLTGPVEDAEELTSSTGGEDDGIPFDGDCDDDGPISDEEYARRTVLAEHPCPGRRCEVCMGNTDHHLVADYDGVHDFYACKHCDAVTEDLDEDGDDPEEGDGLRP